MENLISSVLITIIVVGLLVWRQLKPRRLSERGLILMPLILAYFTANALPGFRSTGPRLTEIAITCFVSLVAGLLACRQLKVYASPATGKAMAGGSWTYFLWWLGAFVVKAGLAAAFGETNFRNVSEFEILLPVLILVVTRNAYLYYKAERLGIALHSRHD
jgi:hypothetical protein